MTFWKFPRCYEKSLCALFFILSMDFFFQMKREIIFKGRYLHEINFSAILECSGKQLVVTATNENTPGENTPDLTLSYSRFPHFKAVFLNAFLWFFILKAEPEGDWLGAKVWEQVTGYICTLTYLKCAFFLFSVILNFKDSLLISAIVWMRTEDQFSTQN